MANTSRSALIVNAAPYVRTLSGSDSLFIQILTASLVTKRPSSVMPRFSLPFPSEILRHFLAVILVDEPLVCRHKVL